MIAFAAVLVSICLSQVNGQCAVQDSIIHVPVPDNKTGLFEGDIRFTDEELSAMQRSVYNVLPATHPQRWGTRGAVVPYVLSADYSAAQRNTITTALSRLSALTGSCIRFVPRTNERDYLSVFKGSGCWSYIGRKGGLQQLSLANGCVYTGIVQHEFLHALGFWHEQSRADRDSYITIQWNNIYSSTCSNFQKTSWTYTSNYGQAYDYSSVMHYGAYAFSRNNLVTISSPKPIGQRTGASAVDILKLKGLYSC